MRGPARNLRVGPFGSPLTAVIVLWLGVAPMLAWAGPLLPGDISGLQAWYRVDQGLTTSAGAVSGWADSSTNSRNMSQGSSSLRPLLAYDAAYGFPVVDFTSSTRWLTAGSSGGPIHDNTDGLTTICMIQTRAASGVVASQFNYNTNLRQWRTGPVTLDVQQAPGGSWNPATASPFTGLTTNQWHVLSGVWAPGGKAQTYINGTWVAEAATAVSSIATSDVSFLMGGDGGGGNPLNGMVSEVLLFNRALTAMERQGVEEYLEQKYTPAKTETIHAGSFFEADVNFEGVGAQASNRPLPPRYKVDAGDAFTYQGDGFWYGWDQGTAGGGRNRNSASSPDERFDTLNHVYGNTWEMAVPDGTYWVRAVFGESSGGTSKNDVTIQGMDFTDPDPDLSYDWDEYFGQVNITGGRLSIAAQAGNNSAKLAFAQVREVIMPDIAINFQPGTSTGGLPANYLVDNGSAFGDRGNGLTYGWVDVSTGDPKSNNNARERGTHPDGRRYTTLNHFRNGASQHADWAIELPNGLYEVLAVFGESQPPSTSTDNMWIGDVAFFDPDPGLGGDWDLFMGRVQVDDGLLLIKPMGTYGKINFLEITLIPEPSTTMLLMLGMLGALVAMGRRKGRWQA